MECKRLENFRLNFNGKILYIAKWHKCFVGFLFYFCFLAFWYGCFFDRKDERLSNLYQTLYDEVPEGRFYSEELSGNNRFQNFLNKFPYYVFCVLKETIKFFLSNFDGFLKGWVFLLDSFFFFLSVFSVYHHILSWSEKFLLRNPLKTSWVSLCMISLFSLAAFKILSLSLTFGNLIRICFM